MNVTVKALAQEVGAVSRVPDPRQVTVTSLDEEGLLRWIEPDRAVAAEALDMGALIAMRKASDEKTWFGIFEAPVEANQATIIRCRYPDISGRLVDFNAICAVRGTFFVVGKSQAAFAFLLVPLAASFREQVIAKSLPKVSRFRRRPFASRRLGNNLGALNPLAQSGAFLAGVNGLIFRR